MGLHNCTRTNGWIYAYCLLECDGMVTQCIGALASELYSSDLKQGWHAPIYIAYDDERDNLQRYTDDIFSNEEADKLYAGISVHWYEDTEVSPMVLTETHNKHPNKFIMMTQASNGNH